MEKTTLSYIYNSNTEQENLNIMNEAHFAITSL